jgi:hypothetical protein
MDERYTFTSCNPDDYTVQEEITIADIASGCLFCARDHDGKLITDEDGNNIFMALSGPDVDSIGPHVYCSSVGRIDG